jgi:hypothetical protein
MIGISKHNYSILNDVVREFKLTITSTFCNSSQFFDGFKNNKEKIQVIEILLGRVVPCTATCDAIPPSSVRLIPAVFIPWISSAAVSRLEKKA